MDDGQVLLEFAVDHSGSTEIVRGGEPPAGLTLLARGFLLVNRTEMRFLYSGDGQWASVRMLRRRAPNERHDRAYVMAGPVVLPLGITRREIEVLTLLSLGLTNAEISRRLGTSVRTVTTQVERLLQKLQQRGRAGLAALSMDSNLLTLPIPGGLSDVAPIATVAMQRFADMLGDHSVESPSDRRRGLHGYADDRLESRIGVTAPIRLGTVAPLSGITTEDGEELVRGASLAVEQINAAGGVDGRSVEHIVAEVDLLRPETVRAAMSRLIQADVDAITTTYVSGENPFLLDMAADFGRPFLHLDAFERHVELVRSDPRRYWMVYQTCPSETNYSLAFRRFLTELDAAHPRARGGRRVAVVEIDSPSTNVSADGFDAALDSAGWRMVSRQVVGIRQTDWSSVARTVVESGADIAFVAHFVPSEVAQLHRSLDDAGYQGLTHYVYGAANPAFLNDLGPLAEGAIWSSVTSRTESDDAARFHRDYVLRYGVAPGPAQASAAYDQVQLLKWAWLRNGLTDPRGTCAALREGIYRGLNGLYSFDNPGQSPLSYPDQTGDPTLGQVLITAQFQAGTPVVLSPEPFGSMSRIRLPEE